jgi:hypothetical protein
VEGLAGTDRARSPEVEKERSLSHGGRAGDADTCLFAGSSRATPTTRDRDGCQRHRTLGQDHGGFTDQQLAPCAKMATAMARDSRSTVSAFFFLLLLLRDEMGHAERLIGRPRVLQWAPLKTLVHTFVVIEIEWRCRSTTTA